MASVSNCDPTRYGSRLSRATLKSLNVLCTSIGLFESQFAGGASDGVLRRSAIAQTM